MSGDEVGGQALRAAEADEIAHPGVVGRRGAADLQRRIDALDRLHRISVQLEIIALLAAPERGQVRLVPDLEEPLPHLLDAVPIGTNVPPSV